VKTSTAVPIYEQILAHVPGDGSGEDPIAEGRFGFAPPLLDHAVDPGL
jgi:hypothetical protein